VREEQRSCVFMPEVKASPATPDKSLSHSRYSPAIDILNSQRSAENSVRTLVSPPVVRTFETPRGAKEIGIQLTASEEAF
jgi:hypothetical protein